MISVLWSCEKTETITESRNKTLIINAFPETGQSISNLKITKFNDSGLLTLPVNDADVNIVWKNNNFNLNPSGNQDGLYAISSNNFEFLANNEYRLEIDYKGEFITGSTVMPSEIEDFEIENSIIDIFNDDGQLETATEMNWRKDNDLVYSVSVTPLQNNPENEITFIDLRPEEIALIRSQLNHPFETNNFSLNPALFTHYGDNIIEIISVDKQFEDFFELNENATTFSNIKNGKGYFIGISKLSIVVKVE